MLTRFYLARSGRVLTAMPSAACPARDAFLQEEDDQVDDGSGKLEIWRVENFQLNRWPQVRVLLMTGKGKRGEGMRGLLPRFDSEIVRTIVARRLVGSCVQAPSR